MTYALSAVLGFLTIGRLLDPDNILHLATAVLAIYVGSSGAEHLGRPFGRRLAGASAHP